MIKLLSPHYIMLALSTRAQGTVHWASQVMYVNSETGPLQYSAAQVLHKPNINPDRESSPSSWRVKKFF